METDLRKLYDDHNQGHVFDFWEELTSSEQSALLEQLLTIDVVHLGDYLQAAQNEILSEIKENSYKIKPFSGKIGSSSIDLRQIGFNAIRNNQVAAVLMAGGQGTRLGFDGPKGMYDIGLPSGRSLFCLIAERILKLIQLASSNFETDDVIRIPLYIMTSPMNHHATYEYFRSKDYFGLPEQDVIFFSQGVLPCLDSKGRIIMENPFRCAMAPDGNGGIFPAMDKHGILSDMKSRGIEHIHTFAIDNALVRPADPEFIGYCIRESADCGNKVVWKKDPHEKVGVIAEKDKKPCVVEYSELSKELAERTMDADDSKLAFGAANIASHYFHLNFLNDTVLPNFGKTFHLAHKKIEIWDAKQKQTVTPSSNNGVKLESFIFDVFPLSTHMAIYEVTREHEFAPVKNAPGDSTDSPDTARTLISNMCRFWITQVGAKLISGGDHLSALSEISPLSSYAGEGLEIYRNKEVLLPFQL